MAALSRKNLGLEATLVASGAPFLARMQVILAARANWHRGPGDDDDRLREGIGDFSPSQRKRNSGGPRRAGLDRRRHVQARPGQDFS